MVTERWETSLPLWSTHDADSGTFQLQNYGASLKQDRLSHKATFTGTENLASNTGAVFLVSFNSECKLVSVLLICHNLKTSIVHRDKAVILSCKHNSSFCPLKRKRNLGEKKTNLPSTTEVCFYFCQTIVFSSSFLITVWSWLLTQCRVSPLLTKEETDVLIWTERCHFFQPEVISRENPIKCTDYCCWPTESSLAEGVL